MSRVKEIIVHSPNGLFVMEVEDGVYALTSLKYATRFANAGERNKAIAYCRCHCCGGTYRYEVL